VTGPGGPARDHGFHRLRVARVVTETEDTRTYVLDIPSDLAEAYDYRAGQFLTFRVDRLGTEHLRCYSMSSAPEGGEPLAVTVKRVSGGAVSGWFHDTVAEGDLLQATRPAGVFCLRHPARPLIAFCGGSGITPVLSLAKSALAAGDRDVHLLYANRDARSVIFAEALSALATDHPGRLSVTHHSDEAAGYLTGDAVDHFARSHVSSGADFYLCGPTPFMDLVQARLQNLGVDPERIVVERFGALPGVPGESTAAPDAAVPATLTLIVGGKRRPLDYTAGDTVLEAARRGAVTTPYSCEAGNCATCMALLREGSATMRVNNALTSEEVDEGWILTCQATLSGRVDVVIEYEVL
jgi:3-ketosteroid 9alpha-monooxygenase subunit B